MKYLKRLGFIVVSLLSIQTITYFAFSTNLLIQEIGKNYETFALDIEENNIENVVVFSEMEPTRKQIDEHFKLVSTFNYTTCTSQPEFQNSRNQDHFFMYGFSNMTRNPFSINMISEGEGAKDYGASWESKYIWVFYRWVLLGKTNTGIS